MSKRNAWKFSLGLAEPRHTAEASGFQEYCEAILNISLDAIVLINGDLQIQQGNPVFQSLFACKTETYLGQSLLNFIDNEDIDRFTNVAQAVISTQTRQQIEVCCRRTDGTFFDAELNIGPIKNGSLGCAIRDITERKRVMEEDRTFQQHLKAIHEITIELMTIDQLDDFYKRAIELGLERLGFERLGLLFYDAESGQAVGTYGTDAHGRVAAEHHLRVDPASLTGILQRAWESPGHFAYEDQAQLFSNGELTGVGWNAVAVLWNGKESLGWLAADNGVHHQPVSKSLLDILMLYGLAIGSLLERKQFEAALRKSEEKFRLLVEAAPLAIILSNQKGQITLVNKRAEVLFGYQRAELLGQTIDLLVPAAMRAQHAANRATYLAAPRVRQMGVGQELHARHKDGQEFPVEIELSYVKTDTGLLVMSFILDISERKQAAEALRTQRDFLQLIINSVPTLITVKDRAGRFQLANAAVAQIYGIPPEAILGKTDADLNPNADEVAFFRQKDQEVLDTRQSIFIPEQTILGHHYQISKLPLKQTTGQPDRLLVVASDISERKQIEEVLQQTIEKEKELGELKSRFVSMASHEFRTPLATIFTLTETLVAYRHRLTDQQVEERLYKIQDRIEHLKAIMEDVLNVARLQARQARFNPVKLDLDALCRSVLDEFLSYGDNSHQLIYTSTDVPHTAVLDKRLMYQILNNLVSNAMKYSSPDVPVFINLDTTNELHVLQVRDGGIGIPEADMNRLFEPFHRAANVDTISGTGLGLSITKDLVDLHGGSIIVESQIGIGTTFTVKIPKGIEREKENAENSDH